MGTIEPAVSVIMLAYNRPQFMRIAIESVLNQTFRGFEFLILDNGSKGDEVFNIAKEYADKDSRVRVSRVADGLGSASGRDKLLHQAQAIYLSIIDDDDFWELDKLQAQVDFMKNNPDVGVYSCSYTYTNGDGVPIGEEVLNDTINPPTQAVEDMPLIAKNYSGSGNLFRRDALLAIGGWRHYFIVANDTDLFFRLQEKFYYASTSRKLVNYRHNAPAARKSGYRQLTEYNRHLPYLVATLISAFYRRKQKTDPINENPVAEDLMLQLPPLVDALDNKFGHKYARKAVKFFLRKRDHARLRQFMKTYGALPNKQVKLYINLCVWSLWYGRLGYWFKF